MQSTPVNGTFAVTINMYFAAVSWSVLIISVGQVNCSVQILHMLADFLSTFYQLPGKEF